MKKEIQNSPQQRKKERERKETREPNPRPGYGDKKLEGPDRPST
ncbi:hypothetical protein C8P63_13322 [Melghirimyces profundicolus]|uniref:Uncharacterized protein n=1 Tax=Melghirimyces profundicolus TaxID=1242148 RepID=A0A2T6B5Z7_9BACL|nr:hypothetical protein [Melghirimyces profundicolus]PTX51490.1 hypothetical protein C8P63_13322 [Melghirimyces profundicolus]